VTSTAGRSQSGGWFGCALTFTDGAVRIVAKSPEHGEATDEIACEFKGKDVTIGISARYVSEALSKVETDEVAIGLGSSDLDTIIIGFVGDESTTMAVSPMRI